MVSGRRGADRRRDEAGGAPVERTGRVLARAEAPQAGAPVGAAAAAAVCWPVQKAERHRRRCARRYSDWYGNADAIATLIRRTLIRTWAPILNSARRSVPAAASANWVWRRPIRRSAASST